MQGNTDETERLQQMEQEAEKLVEALNLPPEAKNRLQTAIKRGDFRIDEPQHGKEKGVIQGDIEEILRADMRKTTQKAAILTEVLGLPPEAKHAVLTIASKVAPSLVSLDD